MKKGKWTEIYTRREKDIPGHLERSEGFDKGQGWACTCGCNKRIPNRLHSEGAPRDECNDGYVPTSGGTSENYRIGYERIKWQRR